MRWISRRASLLSVGLFNLIICCVGLASCIAWFCLKETVETVSAGFKSGELLLHYELIWCRFGGHGVMLMEMALLTFHSNGAWFGGDVPLLQGEGEQLGDHPDGQLHPFTPYCCCPHLQMRSSGAH